MKLKDERAKMCNEILNGIKVIKLYAWEPPMEETVERIRARELALVRKAGFVRAVVDAFNTASPFIVSLYDDVVSIYVYFRIILFCNFKSTKTEAEVIKPGLKMHIE